MARRLACELSEQAGARVHTDMEMWTEIRRKVLVEGVWKCKTLIENDGTCDGFVIVENGST